MKLLTKRHHWFFTCSHHDDSHQLYLLLFRYFYPIEESFNIKIFIEGKGRKKIRLQSKFIMPVRIISLIRVRVSIKKPFQLFIRWMNSRRVDSYDWGNRLSTGVPWAILRALSPQYGLTCVLCCKSISVRSTRIFRSHNGAARFWIPLIHVSEGWFLYFFW